MKEARSGKRKIIIVPPDAKIIRRCLDRVDARGGGKWIYFGRDPLFHLALRDLFRGRLDELPIGGRLQAVAGDTRSDYIEYIGDLSSAYASLPWWLTPVSEKNPFASRLFLYSCYLRIFLEDLGSGQGDRIVVGEVRGLRQAMARNGWAGESLHLESREPSWPAPAQALGEVLRAVARKAWFVGSMTLRVLLSRWFTLQGQAPLAEDGAILLSWADYRSFLAPTYTDVYGGVLGEELRRRGVKVRFLVGILPTLPFLRGLSAIRRFRGETILLEELLQVSDPLAAWLFVRTHRIEPGDIPPLCGLDLRDIVRVDLALGHSGTAAEKAYLFYLSGRRLGGSHPHSLFIHPFENHTWEKMFSASLKGHPLSPRIIGYAHSIVIRMYTCYSLAGSEREIAPRPDSILVNGPAAKAILVESGFEEARVLVGGSFRYPSLAEIPPFQEGGGGRHVLLALSPDRGEALELVCKAVEAFRDGEGMTVTVKCHPIAPSGALQPLLPALPSHFSFSEEPIEGLLARADVVLYTVSTVSVEAVARGIPVIHVKSGLTIDRNIFEGVPWIPSVSDPAELRAAVHAGLAAGRRLGERERKAVADLFAPIDGRILDDLVRERNERGMPRKG
jgi:hypothetical protein